MSHFNIVVLVLVSAGLPTLSGSCLTILFLAVLVEICPGVSIFLQALGIDLQSEKGCRKSHQFGLQVLSLLPLISQVLCLLGSLANWVG
jgi:hypothetical protein